MASDETLHNHHSSKIWTQISNLTVIHSCMNVLSVHLTKPTQEHSVFYYHRVLMSLMYVFPYFKSCHNESLASHQPESGAQSDLFPCSMWVGLGTPSTTGSSWKKKNRLLEQSQRLERKPRAKAKLSNKFVS